MRVLATIVTLVFALAGCASLPEVYQTGRDDRFPPDRYVIGVGQGPTIERARQRAIAAIAAQLEASIEALDALHAADGSDGYHETILQEIRIRTRFDRPDWIQLVDAVESKGVVHALCVLDKVQSAALLEAEAMAHRTALRAQLEQARAAPSLAPRSQAIARARPLARTLLDATTRLAMLRGRPVQPPSEIRSLAALELALQQERQETSIEICVDGLPARIREAQSTVAHFPSLLAGAGVRAVPCGTPAIHRLTGRLHAEPWSARPQAGSHARFCTVRLDWALLDVDEERLEGGGTIGGPQNRGGGPDLLQACHASARRLAAELAVILGLRD